MVECAGLEIRCTVIPYRGFESHLLRQPSLVNTDCAAMESIVPGPLLSFTIT